MSLVCDVSFVCGGFAGELACTVRSWIPILHIPPYLPQVWNSAGLFAVYTSRGYFIEGLGWGGSIVKDGLTLTGDVDYTKSTSSLSAVWSQQEGNRLYRFSIGTCPGCSDVVKCQQVGRDTSATHNDLQLQNGYRYFVNVWHKRGWRCGRRCQCCRGRWFLGSSNGVTVDTTPPIPGRVRARRR